MTAYELNMDGLVGPTHHYAGLARGNLASEHNASSVSNPQAAALQGLEKMRMLHAMGLKQALLPPQARPNLHLLNRLGFKGSASQQLNQASHFPEILSISYSASSMWTANAATVSPSIDTKDAKVHFTAANLISNLHRYQETDFTKRLLEYIFANPNYFYHHYPLPRSTVTSDEGAANHNRLCQTHSAPGIHLFVYGKKGLGKDVAITHKYPARQTLEASEAIARNHLLKAEKVIFAKQNPQVIDQGVFHNDVIGVANESLLLLHEDSFCNQRQVLQELNTKANFQLKILEVSREQVSVKEAVESYLFNSQIISIHDKMILVSPLECQHNQKIKSYIDNVIQATDNPIEQVYYLDLRQSMRNGGGPACLRLRVPLNETELKTMHQRVLVTDELVETLKMWVLKHYRNELSQIDLADPNFMTESFQALDELSQILKLGSIYPFQK